ncbi:hypothetical protein [Hymenobacter negativus]|uniref:Baseplate J-like C-terminal domain-containing protein n=1 Tax=Hymenobacter negativus TaxID=2795026 RepID=A0ABS3QEK7_9BACT|nr:hypothetical protein [Hymenobacter negativus]MBO2009160.1 hypothetical protein [Hymenobacter negativus]
MARSISDIQAAIAADRAARTELAGLTSPSATAIYKLIEYVVAVALWAHETIFDRHQADVNALIAAAPAGVPSWYAARALEFQLGDPLVILPTGRAGYAAGTTGARIVTRATAKENDQTGKLFIKVAKNGASAGTLAALSNAELVQVQGYFARLRFAGTRLEVVSREADRLQLTGAVYYDPLLDVPAFKAAVLAAVQGYLANLAFDGLVYVARLEDAIQAVPGVQDVQLVTVAARVGLTAPTVFARMYETAAGYIVTEETAGLTLADTLTFIPNAT